MKSLKDQVGGSHYKSFDIEPAEFCIKNGLGFAEGNVVKYVSRWQFKGGVEDLKKARHYLDMLLEEVGELEEPNDVPPADCVSIPGACRLWLTPYGNVSYDYAASREEASELARRAWENNRTVEDQYLFENDEDDDPPGTDYWPEVTW